MANQYTELVSPAERFWPKVDIKGPDECWEWQAGMDRCGYGRFRASGPRRKLRAHRVAWTLTCGEIPEGLWVLHKCDNPLCCNIAHLFLGSHTDNMADMVRKGRANRPRGTCNGRAKLDEVQVREIRRLDATGNYMQRVLAEMFGVSHQTISKIVRRRRWAWLDV